LKEQFTNKQLKNMILPLLAEQFMLMLVGLADTFVVSFCWYLCCFLRQSAF